MDNTILTIETTSEFTFKANGSQNSQTGIIEAVLVNVSYNGAGNGFGVNYQYWGVVTTGEGEEATTERILIDANGRTWSESEMNAAYEVIRPGIPTGSRSEMLDYEHQTVLKAEAATKFISLNPSMTTSDWQKKIEE